MKVFEIVDKQFNPYLV